MAGYQPITNNGVTFQIDASDSFYFANAVHRLGFIRTLEVTSSTVLNDIEIAIEFISAAGTLSLPHRIPLGTLGQVPYVANDIPLQFQTDKIFQVTDTQQLTIRIQILAGESVVAEANWQIELLPANYWKDGGDPLNYAAVAAFVQPNHPSIRSVLDDAVEDLKLRGKAPKLSGYQDLAHVDQMVESIYNAVKKRELTYSNPPASWAGTHGQKIRTAQEILDEGVATCLDTATLFASCLEAVGVYPVVALVPGHAFVGYWTGESQQGFERNPVEQFPLIAPIELAASFLDLGFIKLFETTVVCQGASVTFSDAVSAGKRSLEASKAFSEHSHESFLTNVLVARSRSVQLYPMPARFIEANGEVTLVEYIPAEVSIDLLRDAYAAKDGKSANTLRLDVPANVKTWLDGLLDLSLRNPLISIKNRKTSLKLLLPEKALGLLEDALQDDKVFTLNSAIGQTASGELIQLDLEGDRGAAQAGVEAELIELFSKKVLITDADETTQITKLRKIYSEAKTFREETGSNGLYLALGILNWKVNGAEIESPLILVPVQLTARNRNTQFSLALEESGVTPNFSLVEKLKTELGLNLDKLANLETDNLGVNVDKTLDYVREELVKAGHLDFRVDPKAVLGLFNFSSFRLWKDLLENWQKFERNPLVKHLIHTPNEPFVEPVETEPDTDLDSLIAQLPIPADGSQVAAVAKAAAGHTFILQGPPGTGKSQTITNLLAHALDKGLRILFVAEKKDALDVVKERMDASGIGAFSLDLHDKASTSKAVREQLDEVIDIVVNADTTGYQAALADYEAALGPLKSYREQLHRVGAMGLSVYSAKDEYLTINSAHTLDVSGEVVSGLTQDSKNALASSMRDVATLGEVTGNAQKNPWSLSSRATKFTSDELENIKAFSSEVDSIVAKLNSDAAFNRFFANATNFEDLNLLTALSVQGVSASSIEFGLSSAGKEQIEFAKQSLTALLATVSAFPLPISALGRINLASFEQQVLEAMSSGGLFRGMKLNKIAKNLTQQLGIQAEIAKENLQRFVTDLQVISQQEAKAKRDLGAVLGLRFDQEPNLFTKDGVEQALTQLNNIAVVCGLAKFGSESTPIGKDLATNASSELRAIASELGLKVKTLLNLVQTDDEQTKLWIGAESFGSRFVATAREWGKDSKEYGQSNLIRWNDLMVAAKPILDANLRGCLNSVLSGDVPFSDAPNALLKGIYKSLFGILLVQHGLQTFDGTSVNNYIRKLEDAHEGLRARLPKILSAELLSRRGFDSSMKIGAIGDLILAIKQSRNAMPLRTLLSRHWEIITRITPCILASPDSAVRFIDPNFEAFDLVVFDEASQIRVANAIGALGRAKAAVVVGDSQQMPPTAVAMSRNVAIKDDSEEEDEEDPFLIEADSILDKCVNTRMPEIMLNWHYRSADESLIAFSNQAYYQSKLSTFPTSNLGLSEKRLDFRLVKDGQFLRSDDTKAAAARDGSKPRGLATGPLRTNPQEAKAIVEEVVKRLNNPETAGETLGIVTLNVQQREYIKTLLNDHKDAKLSEAMRVGIGADAEGRGGVEIFVKNLETVQGSERDVILFSVAFSALKSNPEKFPLQWGPITLAGGHKRLNVAITRARKAVVIFCSFEPYVLLNKKPTSRGLIDFGAYLAMAASSDVKDIATLATREEKQDRHRHEVLEALRKAGLVVLEEIGLSDFKVDLAVADPKNPEKAVLGILLDGRRWNERKTVSDRDSLPVQLLTQRMGWPAIERIWLPTWIRDQAGEVERIKAAYEESRKKASTGKSVRAASSAGTIKPTVEPIYTKRDVEDEAQRVNPIDEMLSGIPVWQAVEPVTIAGQEYLNYITQPQIRNAVNEVVRELTNYEGPVSSDRAGKFVASCFGFNRVPAARVAAINSVISTDFKRDPEGFIFPIGKSAADFHEWRKSDLGEGRPASEICLTEIANAMADICKVAGGVRFEQLVQFTSKVFGFTKQTKDTVARFQAAVEWGVQIKQLTESGDYITVVE